MKRRRSLIISGDLSLSLVVSTVDGLSKTGKSGGIGATLKTDSTAGEVTLR
jgi:hypothetical protein